MLKNLRNKMYQYIDKYGLDSEKTLKISQEVDLEINNYYNNISAMKYHYEQSILGIQNYFYTYNILPTNSDWNTYAFENDFLSSISIEYIYCNRFRSWCIKHIKQKSNE